MWLVLWHDEADYRNEQFLFESKQNAIKYILKCFRTDAYMKELKHTFQDVKKCLKEHSRYPNEIDTFYYEINEIQVEDSVSIEITLDQIKISI